MLRNWTDKYKNAASSHQLWTRTCLDRFVCTVLIVHRIITIQQLHHALPGKIQSYYAWYYLSRNQAIATQRVVCRHQQHSHWLQRTQVFSQAVITRALLSRNTASSVTSTPRSQWSFSSRQTSFKYAVICCIYTDYTNIASWLAYRIICAASDTYARSPAAFYRISCIDNMQWFTRSSIFNILIAQYVAHYHVTISCSQRYECLHDLTRKEECYSLFQRLRVWYVPLVNLIWLNRAL